MKEIKAIEKKVKQKNRLEKFIDDFFDRFKYDIRKMEVISGSYNLKKQVILHHNALMKAVIYYAVTIKTQGHKEIMGYLVGTQKEGVIEIKDSYIGNCSSSSHYTELDPLETIKLRKMALENNMVILGQWHSHPGFSTIPSGIDDDFMRNLEKFGVKSPVQLIVNSSGFNLSIINKGKRKKAEFIIPPKIDNDLDLNLGFINGEHVPTFSLLDDAFDNIYNTNGDDVNNIFSSFFGVVGDVVLIVLDTYIPFINFSRFTSSKNIKKVTTKNDASN